MEAVTTPIAGKDAYQLWTRLDAEFTRYQEAVSYIPIESTRLQEDLRKYLCLRCAGFLEKLTHLCVHQYLRQTSGGPALEFAKSFFVRAPNLNADTLSKVIRRFGEDHSLRFEEFLTVTLRDSLNDLASVRNSIAHGDTAGGQKLDPFRYRVLCKAIYEWFTSELLNPIGSTTTVVDALEEESRKNT